MNDISEYLKNNIQQTSNESPIIEDPLFNELKKRQLMVLKGKIILKEILPHALDFMNGTTIDDKVFVMSISSGGIILINKNDKYLKCDFGDDTIIIRTDNELNDSLIQFLVNKIKNNELILK